MQQMWCWQAWMVGKVTGGVDVMSRRLGHTLRDSEGSDGGGGERGNITTQQVIWIAVAAALAIAVAGVITVLVMNKANSINLDTPNP